MKKMMILILSLFFIQASQANNLKKRPLLIKREAQIIKVELLGVVCDFCARALEKIFSKQKEVSKINVNLDTNTMTLYIKDNKNLDNDKLQKLVEDAGYTIKTKE